MKKILLMCIKIIHQYLIFLLLFFLPYIIGSENNYNKNEINFLATILSGKQQDYYKDINQIQKEHGLNNLEIKKNLFINSVLLSVKKNKEWSLDDQKQLLMLFTHAAAYEPEIYYKQLIDLLLSIIAKNNTGFYSKNELSTIVNDLVREYEINKFYERKSYYKNKYADPLYFFASIYPLSCCLKKNIGKKITFILLNKLSISVIDGINCRIKSSREYYENQKKYSEYMAMDKFVKDVNSCKTQ